MENNKSNKLDMATYKKYQCPGCGYIYDEKEGIPREGFPAGTRWSAIPDDWACELCAVRDKVDFVQITEA